MFKISVVISSKIVYFKIWIQVTNIISPWEVIQNTIEIVVEIYLIEKKDKRIKGVFFVSQISFWSFI